MVDELAAESRAQSYRSPNGLRSKDLNLEDVDAMKVSMQSFCSVVVETFKCIRSGFDALNSIRFNFMATSTTNFTVVVSSFAGFEQDYSAGLIAVRARAFSA